MSKSITQENVKSILENMTQGGSQVLNALKNKASLKRILSVSFRGFNAEATRNQFFRKAIETKRTMNDALTDLCMLVAYGLSRGNRVSETDYQKCMNPEAIRSLFEMYNVKKQTSLLSPSKMVGAFPQVAYMLLCLRIVKMPNADKISEDTGVSIGLLYPGGASICANSAEFDAWDQWAASFSNLINTKKDANVRTANLKNTKQFGQTLFDANGESRVAIAEWRAEIDHMTSDIKLDVDVETSNLRVEIENVEDGPRKRSNKILVEPVGDRSISKTEKIEIVANDDFDSKTGDKKE